jgi:hypothetical protein
VRRRHHNRSKPRNWETACYGPAPPSSFEDLFTTPNGERDILPRREVKSISATPSDLIATKEAVLRRAGSDSLLYLFSPIDPKFHLKS